MEKIQETDGLTARELLKRVFRLFQSEGKQIRLPEIPVAEIACDEFDQHKGGTEYKLAVLIKIGEKNWLIGFGTRCGSFPADPYNCDIAAFEFGSGNGSIGQKACKMLEKNRYFCHALIYAMADGRLAQKSDGVFKEEVFALLKPVYEQYIAHRMVVDARYIMPFLPPNTRPVVVEEMEYKIGFVPVLYGIFKKTLACS